MSEKMTQKELKQMMDKMFSVRPEDLSFFQKQFSELIETDVGSQLLRSLDTHFDGRKITLTTKAKPGAGGYFFDDKSELGVVVPSFRERHSPSGMLNVFYREVKYRYSEILFHELTHWKQYQHKANAECAATEKDRYFTVVMSEADAQASEGVFKVEQKSAGHAMDWLCNPVKQAFKIAADKLDSKRRFIIKTRKKLRENHPKWPDRRIKQESDKIFFLAVIMQKDSDWRKFYDNPTNRASLGILENDPNYPKRKFPELMEYYMKKYDLSLAECLDLKRVVFAQSNQTFSDQLTLQADDDSEQKRSVPRELDQKTQQTNREILFRASDLSQQPREAPVITSKKTDGKVISRLAKDGPDK